MFHVKLHARFQKSYAKAWITVVGRISEVISR